MPGSVIYVFAFLWILFWTLTLRAGVRGRRFSGPPYCTACRFDLSGLNAPTRCPECGADLSQPRAIDDRHGTPNRPLVWTASIALALGLIFGGFILTKGLTGYDWYRLVPASALSRDVRTASGPSADRALNELLRRQTVKRLSPADDGGLRAALLARVVNLNAAWTPAMQDELWSEYSGGMLSEVEESTYRRTISESVKFIVRPQAVIGAPVPAQCQIDSVRVGPSTAALVMSTCRFKTDSIRLRWDGHEMESDQVMSSNNSFHAYRNSLTAVGMLAPAVATPGNYEAELAATISFTDPVSPGTVVESWTITRSATFVATDQPAAQTTPRDTQVEARLRNGITVRGVVVETVQYMMDKDSNKPVGARIRIPMYIQSSTLPISYRATIHPTLNGTGLALTDQRVGSVALGGSASQLAEFRAEGAYKAWRELALQRAPSDRLSFDIATATAIGDLRVDLVLTPDLEAAQRTTDVTTYPNCELIYRNIPVYVRAEGSGETQSFTPKGGYAPDELRWLDGSTTPNAPPTSTPTTNQP